MFMLHVRSAASNARPQGGSHGSYSFSIPTHNGTDTAHKSNEVWLASKLADF
jgi:hypothetical protein